MKEPVRGPYRSRQIYQQTFRLVDELPTDDHFDLAFSPRWASEGNGVTIIHQECDSEAFRAASDEQFVLAVSDGHKGDGDTVEPMQRLFDSGFSRLERNF